MADNKENIDTINNEANLSIYADHLGLTPEFVKENTDQLDKIENIVKKSLRNINEDDPNKVFNVMKQLQNITKNTIAGGSYSQSDNLSIQKHLERNTTHSGFHLIRNDLETKDDTELFNFHNNLFNNYRHLVSEYRNIGRLIPVVYRCADMKARDILAINEITKKSISNIYIPNNDNLNTYDSKELMKNPINKQINSEILERYDVENKLPRYLMTSLIEGAKPVVVYPFKDIVNMAYNNIDEYSRKFSDFNMRKDELRSSESFDGLLLEYHRKKHKLVPEFKVNPNYSTEEFHEANELSTEGFKIFRDKIIDKFISKDDLNEYFERGIEDISNNIEKIQKERLLEIYGSNNINKLEQINETRANFRELQGKVRIDGALSDHFKDQIFNAIKTIDDKVEFFDQSEAVMGMAINNFRRIAQFNAYRDNPKAGVIAYGVKPKEKNKMQLDTPFYDQDLLTKHDSKPKEKNKSVLDDFDDFSQNNQSLLEDCLIKEYDSEDVIPIIVSGKHIAYYVVEVGPYTGNAESINKRNNNFTDMFINMGFQNDAALSPTAVNATGIPNAPTGPMGALGSSYTAPGVGSLGLGAASDISMFDTSGFAYDAIRRNNIMKKIIFNVLKQKLNKHDLEDEETFSDTIMSLIRDGAIVQNNVKIIYIPEKYMCYFSPELDGNGIPQSFLKNCLFTCYERIAINHNNIITRLTRSAVRDKLTINMNSTKAPGHSIRAIENALTTRRLNTESPLTSLSRVLRASSTSETIIVPVFDGEKLYEYEDLTKTNDVPPNDDLEQKLDNEIVTSLKCPITITNPYQEEDFASLAASRNAEYRYDLIKLQAVFAQITTKFIKLLIVGSGLYDKLKKADDDFSLKNIKVIFSPPENLNMKNANDTFGTVASYIENIISICIDPNDETEMTNILRNKVKQTLYQKLMPGLGLDEYIVMINNLVPEALKDAIEYRKTRSINDQIVNTSYKPIMATPDGKVIEAESQGIGNDDSSGGW